MRSTPSPSSSAPVTTTGPVRTCIGCRLRRPDVEMTRLSLQADGTVMTGRGPAGRGAWLCTGSAECLRSAIGRRAFERAWRRAPAKSIEQQLQKLFEPAAQHMKDFEAVGAASSPTKG